MSRELWEREYVERAISSSTNERPSHGAEFLRHNLARIVEVEGPPRLLDLGCGAGRNAAVLEETGLVYHGMDYAHRPLIKARGRSATRLVQASMADPLPFRSATFSLVAAFTSIENVVRNEELSALAGEVHRVLCPAGLLLVYFLTDEDAYYRPLVRRSADGRSLTYDPVTGLRQRVYRMGELRELFSPRLELLASDEFAFVDTRSRGTYERRLAAGLWKRA